MTLENDYLDKRMWRLYANAKGYEIYTLVIGEENRNLVAFLTNFTEDEKNPCCY